MLLSLPPETLINIFNHVVLCTGIRRSVPLRTVCRSVNGYVLGSIYTLPTFEDPNDDSPEHLSWDNRMSKAMVTGLIRNKLMSHRKECMLVRQILGTSKFITEVLIGADEEIYTTALVWLAADNVPLHEIIERLSKNSKLSIDSTGLLENALAAALYLDQTVHVQALLDQGAKARYRTKWFGDALLTAASCSTAETFWAVLTTALATEVQTEKRIVSARLITALEHAAAYGKAEIFHTDLWPFIVKTYEKRMVHTVFEPAIRSASLFGHERAMSAIFDLLIIHDADSLHAMSDSFWKETLRLIASNGLEQTAQLVLTKTAISNVYGSLNLPLEDACRTGSEPVVKLLLLHQTAYNLNSYAGSFFWAARGAHYGILSLLVQHVRLPSVSHLGNALCGASVHGTSSMAAVFKIVAGWSPTKKDLRLDGKTFAQIMDLIFQVQGIENLLTDCESLNPRKVVSNSSEDDIFRHLLSEEHCQLAQACHDGFFGAVCDTVARFGDGATAASPYSAGGFSESITQQHPGILRYLCEKFPSNRHFTADLVSKVRSTAVLQVLLDNNWTIDAKPSRLKPPILGSMVQSAEMVRWVLDHGSDPNARCDWDITPLSMAVKKAHLSTIQLMLQYGGDTRKGQLLHFAVERKSPDQLALIDMLICFGAPIDGRMFENDPDSWAENKVLGMGAPLHTAVACGNTAAAEHLIWRGASCEVLDTTGRSALDLARRDNQHDLVEMIRSRYAHTPQSLHC